MKYEILSCLPASFPWRGNIHHFTTIDSTNTQAKRMAAAGAPHGTVLVADAQTAGRGRLGRTFHSPADAGVYLSLILRPQLLPGQLMHLTCAVAVAMCDAVEQTIGLRPHIKWTNDLVAQRKKLGGILTELSVGKNGLVDYAVIGIGINCNQLPEDFPEEIADIATSCRILCGQAAHRPALIARMVEALEQMSRNLSDSHTTLARYRKDCITIGQKISVLRADDIRHGTALDVDESGALMVLFEDGHTEAVSSGEVSIRGMYGYV